MNITPEPGRAPAPDELAAALHSAHERQGAALKAINLEPE